MINIGDKVTAYWTINGEQFTGIVLNMPCGPGELWYLQSEKGYIVAINPCCSNFEQICKAPDVPAHTEKKGGIK